MNRANVITAILVAILVAFGIDTWLIVNDSRRLAGQVSIVCAEHQELARIAREEAEEGAAAQVVTARINIPGLTHAELVELTAKKQARKEHRAAELQTISHHTC